MPRPVRATASIGEPSTRWRPRAWAAPSRHEGSGTYSRWGTGSGSPGARARPPRTDLRLDRRDEHARPEARGVDVGDRVARDLLLLGRAGRSSSGSSSRCRCPGGPSSTGRGSGRRTPGCRGSWSWPGRFFFFFWFLRSALLVVARLSGLAYRPRRGSARPPRPAPAGRACRPRRCEEQE